MARRKGRHSIAIYGAEATAKRTIEHLLEKIKEEKANPAVREEWVSHYIKGIERFGDDPARVEEAKEKLTTWYNVLESEVAPKYSAIMSEARAMYYKRLAEKYRKLAEAEEVKKYIRV